MLKQLTTTLLFIVCCLNKTLNTKVQPGILTKYKTLIHEKLQNDGKIYILKTCHNDNKENIL